MSMDTLRITVPWDVAQTADNRTRRGGHWSQRHRVMKAARERARLAWLEAGQPVMSGRVRVSAIIRRGRLMDCTNAIGGMKPLLDGLFVRAITPDDSPAYLEFGRVRQETGKAWRDAPEVEFIVEPLP